MKVLETLFAWVHLSCAQWVPETQTIPKQSVKLSKLDEKRYTELCSICNTTMGVTFPCSSLTHPCALQFHVECARRANYYLEVVKPESSSAG